MGHVAVSAHAATEHANIGPHVYMDIGLVLFQSVIDQNAGF